MKKSFYYSFSTVLLALLLVFFAGCGAADTAASTSGSQTAAISSGSAGQTAVTDTPAETETPAADVEVTAEEATGDFQMTTDDGAFSESGNVRTITAAGTYVLTGALDGQIVVDAGQDDVVILELTGTTITNGSDSPIHVLCAGSVEISAKSGTDNVIRDTRTAKTADDSSMGEGAISASTDLKIKGSGTLVIEAGYNNGIHTTKDLTIRKLTLKVTAVNNALRGGDSVTVKSGTVVAISTSGNGVKTVNTDQAKDGSVRGDVTIEGGSVSVYAAGDGIEASHNVVFTEGEDGAPTVRIYTGSYSSYTSSGASTASYKGVKAENEVVVEAGSIEIRSYDDGLHANSGTAFEAGGKGLGNVTISGGSVTMNVYAPEGKTGGGRMGPGGWGGQQTVSGADAIHADGTLSITGGSVMIDSAYEGLEANIINISGGKTYVTASDDGVNACKGSSTPAVNITGGYPGGNVFVDAGGDGIDSNGTYTQTGGIVITRGPNSEMAAALDADGTVKITGGTLIVLGYSKVSAGGGVKSVSLSLHGAGAHTVTIDGASYTFNNAYTYGRTTVYSDVSVSA